MKTSKNPSENIWKINKYKVMKGIENNIMFAQMIKRNKYIY